MKRRYGDAARAKAARKWDYVEGVTEEEEIAELLDWHSNWCPTPEETGNTPEYFAANPSLPF